jgi:hypothetical protein
MRSGRDQLGHKLRLDAWAEKLMHMLLGATMTQVALCRFLIGENVIDRQRLLAFLEKRGVQWSKTSSDEALLPLVTVLARVKPVEEPDFPVARLRPKARPVWQASRRRTHNQAGTPRKASQPSRTAR